MSDISKPIEYPEWRMAPIDRAEDAAYTFGSHLIQHCRTEAIEDLPNDLTSEQRTKAIHSIDVALHNVMDMLEGFWPLDSGKEHPVEYVLQVLVKNSDGKELERVEISPCKLDLPIGYWKWALDNEFQ